MSRFTITSLAVALAAFFALANESHAVFISSNGTFTTLSDQFPVVNGPPLPHINTLTADSAGSRIYTNQYSGAAFQAGGEIRTISIQVIDGAINGIQTPIGVGGSNDELVALTVLRGVLVSGISDPAGPVTFFTAGTLFLLRVPGVADVFDPASFSTSQIVATFDLISPEAAINGPTGAGANGPPSAPFGNQPASNVNLSALQALLVGQPSGQFLFAESPNTPDPNFLTAVDTPIGQVTRDTALFTQITQLAATQTANVSSNLNAADLTAMNSFYELGLGAGNLFATGLGSAVQSDFGGAFNPGSLGTSSGDFQTNFESRTFVGYTAVIPEPSSIALFSLGAIGMGIAMIRRRRAEETLSK